MNPYALGAAAIGGVLLAVALTLGGYKAGAAVERDKASARELERAEKIIVRREREVVEVPKIVTKFVERKVTVEKEVERVITRIPQLLDADCVLPGNYGLLLVAAANGIDPENAAGVGSLTGPYGCREVLAATLLDLEAGWKNTEQLRALQRWAALVTQSDP